VREYRFLDESELSEFQAKVNELASEGFELDSWFWERDPESKNDVFMGVMVSESEEWSANV
jgi:hypothetical protein